jgi:hypothetical protein
MMEIVVKPFAIAVLAAWIPAVLVMFAFMRPRRAVIAAFVGGYLLLPEVVYHFHTVPDVDKASLTALGVILGSFIFDGGRLLRVRPRWIDLAALGVILAPMAASLSNDLGIMDGLSASFNVLFRWGLAYWIGRAYFTDWEGVRELAMGIIIGGLVYVPLCWWEIRMSPQLHGQVYGPLFTSFRTDTYLFGVQLFGFRPNVFLADGLTVTMYMGVASVLAYWAWMTRSPKKLLGLPMWVIVLVLTVTAFFSKAMGGIALMLLGMAVLTMTRWPKTRLPLLLMMLAVPAYISLRATGDWSGDFLVQRAQDISATRAQSLEFRLHNETLLSSKALKQPVFGWGGWSRSHVFDWDNNDITIIDGLWILLLGETGLFGLGAFVLMGIGTVMLLWKRIPTRFWADPACAAPVALAVVITMYMIDSLFNTTFNPITMLAIGAVASIGGVAKSVFSRQAQRSVPFAAPAYAGAAAAVVASPKDLPYVYSTY